MCVFLFFPSLRVWEARVRRRDQTSLRPLTAVCVRQKETCCCVFRKWKFFVDYKNLSSLILFSSSLFVFIGRMEKNEKKKPNRCYSHRSKHWIMKYHNFYYSHFISLIFIDWRSTKGYKITQLKTKFMSKGSLNRTRTRRRFVVDKNRKEI